MNRFEFLDILKDYLKDYFSEIEIEDILRDYEEYFLDGTIEGKRDIEIIKALGSPKNIASELIAQTKGKNREVNKFDIKYKYKIIKSNIKDKCKQLKSYINDKFNLNIEYKNHNKKRKLIELAIKIVSLILFLPTFIIGLLLLGIGFGLISLLALYIGTMPILIPMVAVTKDVTWLYIFISIAFIGCQILTWQIYIFVIANFIELIRKYKNWVKRKKLYIKASRKKEFNDNLIDKEEDEKDYE